ncbi:DUF2637 domain-containing protein [Nonomuraea sp. NPDC026600]|uniref:DUF2637 domain-containing protein n=1 Tax=Nonomuraea sp. NPDC026600 TaxID=3155363 RepID=UPI0033C7A757
MVQDPTEPTLASAEPPRLKRRKLARTRAFLTVRFHGRRDRAVPPVEPVEETGTRGVGDFLIRAAAVIVVLGVAAAAGYVSYHHFFALSIALGEHRDMAVLYPAMSDGVIVMASLVMVHCSRRGVPVPLLAKAALVGGGIVTLIANVANGWDGGTGSRLLSALAPIAFVGAYELLMWIVRSSRKVTERVNHPLPEEHVCQPVEVPVEVERVVTVMPVDRFEAARLTFEESLQTGNKRIGRRALANRWGLESREAEEIITEVERERAGSVEPDAPEEPVTKPAVRWGDRVVPTGTAPSPEVRQRITQMRDEALMNDVPVPSSNGSSATGTAVAP